MNVMCSECRDPDNPVMGFTKKDEYFEFICGICFDVQEKEKRPTTSRKPPAEELANLPKFTTLIKL